MSERPGYIDSQYLEDNESGTFYAPAMGADFDSIKADFRQSTAQEKSVANISLAALKQGMGGEITLTPKEAKILADPRSMGGANVFYVADRVRYGYGRTAFFARLKDKLF